MDINQCVNCAVRFQRNVQRHSVFATCLEIRQLLSVWISRQICHSDAVCGNCFRILQRQLSETNIQAIRREFGYRSICFPCGSSILRTASHAVPVGREERNIIISWIPSHQVSSLERVCMACWLRATRSVQRTHQQDELREELSIMEDAIIPVPPPLPVLAFPLQIAPRPATINMLTYKRAASTSRHCIFTTCENISRLLVPTVVKERLLFDYSLYVPRSARICEHHLYDNHNSWNELSENSNCSEFTVAQMEDLCFLLKSGSNRYFSMENVIQRNEMLCKYWLGVNIQQFEHLLNEIPSIREKVKFPKTALAAFLLKLRTGDSNYRIASIFNISATTVFRYLAIVRDCFQEQFLPLHLGIDSMSIEQVAQRNLIIPNGLFGNTEAGIDNFPAIVICDGTYIYVQKSSNYLYQKKTYSLHKYRNLIKPFLIVCCNGYILDTVGPYPATESDATIMSRLFRDGSPMQTYFRSNDVFILDRGFRDVVPQLRALGYRTHMPESLEEGQHQLTTLQANKSRCVTMCRWVVEVVNGRFKRDFKLFRQEYFNRASTHLMLDFKIAASLINWFHPVIEDSEDALQILEIARSKINTPNHLATFVLDNNLNRVRVQFTRIDGNLPELEDFPRLGLRDLRMLSLGIYQIKQARSYYGEHVRQDGAYEIEVCRDMEAIDGRELLTNKYILRGRIRSRHTTRKTYFTYILVNRDASLANTIDAVAGYYCNCLVGSRTVGCCAHVMTVVWFLGWARYQNDLEPPASFLDGILLIRDDVEHN